jgi:hypothetical protein
VRRALPFALLALLAAGCGARSTTPYTAAATVPCLQKEGFKEVTTDPAKIGFIAAFAENGGLRATAKDGNTVTVAFAADAEGVPSTERAFRNRAPKGLQARFNDILRTDRNAVMVWTTSPSSEDQSALQGCLAS